MATIHKQFKINAPIDQVWANISDLTNVHTLFSMLDNTEIKGNTRTCRIQDGGELKELIISVDETKKRLVYAITESPFNFEFHCASWQVIPGNDGTIFEWYTDIKPDNLASTIKHVIDSEQDNIVKGLAQ